MKICFSTPKCIGSLAHWHKYSNYGQ